jgi:hypothetical protein
MIRLSTTILLCCVFNAPAMAAAQETAKADGKPRRQFVAYAWHGERGKHDNIIPLYWLIRGRLDPMQTKAATDAMPPGHRVLFSWDLHNGLARHREDNCRDADGKLTRHQGIWWDHGTAEIAQRFDDFFRRYREVGGEVDALVLDFEEGMSNWSLRRDTNRYHAIMADPRFEPVAARLGFRDLMTVMDWQAQGGKEREHYRIWNALMEERAADYVRRAIYEPIRKHFPNIKMSNWESSYNASQYACPDRNGYQHSRHSAGVHVGTHQSVNLYCWLGNLRRVVMPGGAEPYGAGPFEAFRLSVNSMRTMVLSSNVPAWPWISHKRFKESWVRESDLYQELIFHAGLCGPDQFLYWNPRPNRPGQNLQEHGDEAQDQLLSECLSELDELVGTADRKRLVQNLAGWYDDFVLTGMSAGGRTVWRFTPKLLANQKREDVLHSKAPVTFRTAQKEIRFSEGTVHARDRELSDQGYWIIGPLHAKPTITTRTMK